MGLNGEPLPGEYWYVEATTDYSSTLRRFFVEVVRPSGRDNYVCKVSPRDHDGRVYHLHYSSFLQQARRSDFERSS